MRSVITIFCLVAGLFVSCSAIAQQDTTMVNGDSTVVRSLKPSAPVTTFESVAKEHSPTRAALLSAVLPGLGQAYNKKFWKIPIVWAGFGTFGYFINWNNNNYQFYRKQLIYEVAGDPNFPNETGLDKATLQRARDYYRRNRDQLAIYGILFYFLQIVDAHVDAHLIEFDVNQDLSVKLEPGYIPLDVGGYNSGLSIKVKF